MKQKIGTIREREAAYKLFCEQPMRITREQLSEIVNEDALGL
jgi:hypothetical protein